MSSPYDPYTEDLLRRASGGDKSAIGRLFTRHRDRLRRMVAVRMDDRLSTRIDPSDVVQEALAVAAERLPGYLQKPTISFYAWLRQIAWDRLVDLHRRHIGAGKRSVCREEPAGVSNSSAMQLAEQLLASSTGPLRRLLREEMRARMRSTLARLSPGDREILLLRHLEQLNRVECAGVLGINEAAVKQRHVRAVRRLHKLLESESWGEG